jgi:hypothetical protein
VGNSTVCMEHVNNEARIGSCEATVAPVRHALRVLQGKPIAVLLDSALVGANVSAVASVPDANVESLNVVNPLLHLLDRRHKPYCLIIASHLGGRPGDGPCSGPYSRSSCLAAMTNACCHPGTWCTGTALATPPVTISLVTEPARLESPSRRYTQDRCQGDVSSAWLMSSS